MVKLQSDTSKWFIAAALFACCAAPCFISYRSYFLFPDGADSLARSILVSRAFWSGHFHGLSTFLSADHPPAMMLLGIPWGPIASWESASKCFYTLAALQSVLASSCLYMLLRIGVKPLVLVAVSFCVCAAIGPFPAASRAHLEATSLLADGLLGWTSLAAMLLIPFEARVHSRATGSAILRGIAWGLILSLGVLAKLNFLFFVGLVVPTLFFIKLRHDRLRNAFAATIAMGCVSAPCIYFLLRHGNVAFNNAKSASFGLLAHFYYVPLSRFLYGMFFHDSPGLMLSIVFIFVALVFLALKWRGKYAWPDFIPIMIMIGFTVIVLSSPSKDVRYLFPPIVAIPFLLGILISREGFPAPRGIAKVAAALVLLAFLAAGVPTRNLADRASLSRCDAVVSLATRFDAKRVVLATDSVTLNINLMRLDGALSGPSFPAIEPIDWSAVANVPIEEDYRTMRESDMVVFQDQVALFPAYTNQRVSEYEQYARQNGRGPIRAGTDLNIYLMR
ncbi:MAG: hypothetical protein WBV28_23670 [Terracidiphilus sp.]